MNRSDIGEIRRRLQPEKTNCDRICGCYVDAQRIVRGRFCLAPFDINEETFSAYLSVFRRVLGGSLGRNLLNLEFNPVEVQDSEKHSLLMSLRDTRLKVPQAVDGFFDKIAGNLKTDEAYLILLMYDVLGAKKRDDNEIEEDDATQFSYLLCAVCPLKMQKTGLCYDNANGDFRIKDAVLNVSAPTLGFMFPAYEEGGANFYASLYYTKDTDENREDFIGTVFGLPVPMAATQQKETFDELLSESLGNDCNLELVQNVQEQLRTKSEAVKSDRNANMPTTSKSEVAAILEENGVAREHISAFEEAYSEAFGDEELSIGNLVPKKQTELRTPDVIIRVKPDRNDLVQTRIIDGMKYILINANEGVEINGVSIAVDDLGEDI